MSAELIGHDELARRLASHLGGSSDRMVWTDMQLGPAGSKRPDVWTLNKSYSAPRPLAYEVKVSKADYQRDVAAGKWQHYLRYSCAVTFAAPAGLVAKADLPKGCGLIVWNGEGWTTTKAPTLNPCPELPRDLMMKLLIDGCQREAARQRLEQKTAWHAQQAVGKRFGKAVAQLVSEEIGIESRLAAVRARYAEEEKRERDRSAARRDEYDRMISDAHGELCRALGLEDGCSPYDITHRCRELAKAVSRDTEVRTLRHQLGTIRHALEAGESTPNAKLMAGAEP